MSKTSAPRYTTPCSESIAATQERDTGPQTGRRLDQRPARRQVHQRDIETGPQPQPPEPGQLHPFFADGPAAIQ